jgi:hypothetical protein
MSPFIVCVNVPGCLPEQAPRAVATLEDAQRRAQVLVENAPDYVTDTYHPFAEEARWVPFSGGTVGPLPDGCVIDVRPVSWAELCDLAGLSWASYKDSCWHHAAGPIIDAYNNGAA